MSTKSKLTAMPGGSQEDILEKIPGAESSARIDAWWWMVVLVVVITLYLILGVGDPYDRIWRYVGDGIWITVYVTVLSFLLTLAFGLVGGLGRLSKNRIINGISSLYVELVRGVPLMVQLIWWYFAFPTVLQGFGRQYGLDMLSNYQANPNAMAILGLTFCYGAYMSEIYRAGIQSIPPGQMEAARSLGMNYLQAMRYIILPQAVRVILPPVGNEFIALLKDSSLVSVVAVTDLTRRGREFMATNFNPIEVWSFVALIYLIMTLMSARAVNSIENRTKVSSR
jgi:polar amino acid transport system permease protein